MPRSKGKKKEVSFAQVPGCIIHDGQLSTTAKVLYAAIKLRCIKSKTSMYAGQPTLASDIGKSLSTVERAMRELRKRGLISSSSRGFNRSNLIRLTDVHEVYGDKAYVDLRAKRRDHEGIDPSELTVQVHHEQRRSPVESAGFSPVDFDSLESDQNREEEEGSGSEEVGYVSPPPGPLFETSAGEEIESSARNDAVRSGSLKDGEVNKTDPYLVEQWFGRALKKKYGDDYKVAPWEHRELEIARKLLEAYGEELTKMTIRYVIQNWAEIVGRYGNIAGKPNIRVLNAFKDSFFGEAQSGSNSKRQNAEYDAESAKRSPSIGWGDLAKRPGERPGDIPEDY